jgi:hypothetical protein
MSQEPGSCGYNKRETKSISYKSYRIMPSEETLRYCGKPIRIGRTPESRPRRSWQPKQNEHNSWRRKRGSRRGRPTPRRRKEARTRGLMRDDRGHVMYDQEGHVRYLPHDGPHDGPAKKKKKPPPRRPDSPPSLTTPMATSTPTATRKSTRARTTPHHLRDYINGLNSTQTVLASSP